jgi:hypothetical protein
MPCAYLPEFFGVMNKLSAAALNCLLIAAMFAVAGWAIHMLPAGGQVAIHWGPDGQPDAWVGEWAGLLVIPIVAGVVWFLLSVYPPAGVRPAAVSHVLLFQLAAEVLIAIHALGREVDTSNHIAVALGVLYIAVGFQQARTAGRWVFGLSGLGILLAAFGLEQGDKVLGIFLLALGGPLLVGFYSARTKP